MINNPVIGRCSWNHYRKFIYLREKTFLSYFPRTPASVIFNIIYLWLIDKDNASTITSKLNYQLNNYHITKGLLVINDKIIDRVIPSPTLFYSEEMEEQIDYWEGKFLRD